MIRCPHCTSALYPGGLGPDLYGGADWDERPDLVDFFIGYSNAAERPVIEAMTRADQALAVRQAMDHDGAAGRDVQARCSLAIFGVWIGDVQRLVIGAVLDLGVDDLVAFRGAGVALALFGSQTALAKGDLVGSDHLATGEQLEDVILFEDEDRVGFSRSIGARGCESADGEGKNCEDAERSTRT